MRPSAVVTALADSTTSFITAVLEQVVPALTVKVASRAFIMVLRVFDVLSEGTEGTICSVATVTPPIAP